MKLHRVAAVVVATILLALGLAVTPAAATTSPTLAVPATGTVNYNQAHAVTGITLSAGGQTSVQIALSVAHGTLSMSTTTGLTFVSGNGNGTSAVQFTASPANAQAALNTLSYTPSNYVGSDTLNYSTIPGGGLYNPANGHFYEFIDTHSDLSWTQAKTAADATTFNGQQGYLATITSASEQAFVSSKLNGQGWFGASDDPSQGTTDPHWIWADGPEAGQEFWNGIWSYSGPHTCVSGSCAAVSGRYNNWLPNAEPNNFGGSPGSYDESFAHFLDDGHWNDFPDDNGIQKYLVEFGGTEGDANLLNTQTTALTVNAVAPAVPTDTSVTPGNGQFSVSWVAPAGNGAAIDGYKVEYSTNGITWTTATTSATSPTIVSGLVNGTAYQVRVSAHNSVGYGPTSGPQTVTPVTIPGAPQNVAVSKANGQTVVSWTAPASNGGATITGYKVEYSSNNGDTFTTAQASTTSPLTITGLVNGTAYRVKVTPINSVGFGAPTLANFIVGGLPSAPQNLTATSGSGSATVRWVAPSTNGGLPITSYRNEYSTDGTNWTVADAGATSPVTITGLTNGTTYSVRISALNSQGIGPTVTTTVTPLGVASAPSNLVVVHGVDSATVSWDVPTDNGGTPITGYTLEYRLAGGTWVTASASATSPMVISGITPGADYEVRLAADNIVGAGTVASAVFTTNSLPASGISAPLHIGNDGVVTTVPVYNTNNPAQVTASTPTGDGSWSLNPDGGVFTAGDANFFGSMGGQHLNAPAVGITPTSTGGGYYVVGDDGGVFTFGDAQFNGSMGGQHLNAPVTAIGPSCSSNGYYLVAGDGGVFAFGDAGFHGSMGGKHLNASMIGIVDSCGSNGYWTFAKDGGVFTFGDAQFYGSLGSHPPAGGIIGMVSAPDGQGYWLIGADKKAYGFGSVASTTNP